jgi:hypothetical protein
MATHTQPLHLFLALRFVDVVPCLLECLTLDLICLWSGRCEVMQLPGGLLSGFLFKLGIQILSFRRVLMLGVLDHNR